MYYGYGYGYGKSDKGSVSGWERSHFGGYYRVLSDYPFISINYELEIKPSELIMSQGGLGRWMAEKLIKLYLLKAKEITEISKMEGYTEKRQGFLGKEKTFYVVPLNNESLFSMVCGTNSELAPMFEHYKEGILDSTVEIEVREQQGEGEGEGKGEGGEGGEGENKSKGNSNRGEEGENEGEGKGSGSNEGDSDDQEESNEGEGEGGGGVTRFPDMRSKTGKHLEKVLEDIEERKPYVSKYAGSNIASYEKEAKFVSVPKNDKAKKNYSFAPATIKNSEHLIKLLDINFDPTSEVVKNLKLGKLDVSKIAEVPAGNLSVYKREIEDQDTEPFTVCILADLSGSMTDGRSGPQLRVLNSLYLAMSQILPEDKLYIYGHTGSYEPEIYTFYSPYDTDYEKNIQSYYYIDWVQNYDGPVVEAIHKKVRSMTSDRVIFITLSDGEPCGYDYGGRQDYDDFKKILEKARRDSFVTVGIGIQSSHVKELYTYAKNVTDLKDLPKEVAGIVNKVVRSEFK